MRGLMRGLLRLGLGALLLCGGAAAARADEEHGTGEAQAAPAFGPLISAASPGGFTVRIGTPDLAPRAARLLVFDAAARPGPGTPPRVTLESPAAVWHTLRVTGLVPAQRYRYRVLLSGQPPLDGEVGTAPPLGSEQPLTLAVFGDERGPSEGVAPGARAIVQAVLAESPDAVVGTGDLVTRSRLADWQSLMRSHGPLFAQLLYLPALGNHELWSQGSWDADSRFVRDLFPVLDQEPRGAYRVRLGSALLVFLDGNRPGSPDQTRFLDETLAQAADDAQVGARLVVLHQPPLSASAHCGMSSQMRDWIALFERHHVDAVIAGHDHTYQRLERAGIAYFVSGGGGAPLYARSACSDVDEQAVQRYEAAHHYLIVRITPRGAGAGAGGTGGRRRDLISVVAHAPQGAVLDAVTLPLPRAQPGSGPLAAIDPKPLMPHGARFVWFKIRRAVWTLSAGLIMLVGLRVARRRRRARLAARLAAAPPSDAPRKSRRR